MHSALQEQFFARQNHLRNQDDEEFEEAMFALAQGYKSASYECKKHAYMRGVKDARVAKKCWEQPPQQKPAMPMVPFAVPDATSPVAKKSDKMSPSTLRTTTTTPANFLQRLVTRRRQVYSLAA